MFVDIDECLIQNKCGIDGVCKNTLGSFKCSCKQGFKNVMGNCIGKFIICCFIVQLKRHADSETKVQ